MVEDAVVAKADLVDVVGGEDVCLGDGSIAAMVGDVLRAGEGVGFGKSR